MLGGECQRLVEGVGVQALGAAQHAGQRLESNPDQVDLGLLRGERHAGGLGVEAQLARTTVGRPVVLAHPAGPDAPGGPVLGDLLEEVTVGVEEEAEPRREVVDRESRRPGRLDVSEPVGQGEGKLLRGGRTCLANVVAGDRDRVPARQLCRAEAHHVGDQPHRRARREDVLLLRLVLLEDVVLDGAREGRPVDAGPVGHAHVHGEHRRGRRVDRHGGGHLPEIDARKERLHVGLRVDGDPGPSHLALGPGVVGVAAEERGHVESGRQPVPARLAAAP